MAIVPTNHYTSVTQSDFDMITDKRVKLPKDSLGFKMLYGTGSKAKASDRFSDFRGLFNRLLDDDYYHLELL
ncbi:hypothetical protein HRR90_008172 [Exophiala dermatitidis]|uniref:Uncharacterized protein n=1 Tax=Exophiala dermatitidis TaxID=5970 RepID=A0AAN6IUX6_EXODE|nr:hypothetical protein HRR75_003112 [Exophiala dermatitidis]KAJ4521577.1 hypothetical protein HRR74_003401 [Exophiala dermatitidis]KAJ4545021.1 hypothetical protein HRR76_003052 [Exophiala dermatitidis]KAJ4552166.1 hypothetical protein HRR78_003733 [Exophiala dermatitidis]KAJ4555014.1 hypothetical protein HRR79_009125 [Exophiala dermatitidis]